MRRADAKKQKFKIPVLNIVLILFCTLLIIVSTFININLRHYILPHGFFSGGEFLKEDFIFMIPYIPQIPVLMFVCSMLGKKMALTSTILYILAGLTIVPVFAMGGGLQYIGEYSFGYIFAYIPAIIIAGQFLRKKYTFLTMFLAALTGVLIIHFCGILYMMLIALIRQDGGEFIRGWIGAQSGLKIVYDLIFSYVGIIIGKYVNSFVKFVLA